MRQGAPNATLAIVSASSLEVFLLGRETQPTSQGWSLTYWAWSAQGPVCIRLPPQPAVMFVPREVEAREGDRRPVDLRTLDGRPVDALYFGRRHERDREARRLRHAGTPAWEDDLKPADRYLMERFITAGALVSGESTRRGRLRVFDNPRMRHADVWPTLTVASFDVESEGLDGPLLSVAVVMGDDEKVFVRGQGPPLPCVTYGRDEAATLRAFLAYVQQVDPDVLIGWNCVDFDLAYLERRCRTLGVPFALGRGETRATVLAGSGRRPSAAWVPGRVVLDGIATMRAATWSFERWSLEHVARALLGRGKRMTEVADPAAEIRRLHLEDVATLVEYNLEDCRLVCDIFDRAHLIDFAIERQRLTGLSMDRRAGAVAAFDFLYLPRLHRHGRVAPSTGTNPEPIRSPGGYVLDSDPGLYENVLVLDFKSLYPSLIRTFRIDPLGLAVGTAKGAGVEGFGGARFDPDEHILPGLIEELWAARDRAKARGDQALSQAIKILMNSFYGVLGTPACRFYDPRLASSITLRGHEVLTRTKTRIEDRGWRVIYGDTDSLFVLLGPAHTHDAAIVGRRLVAELNEWWQNEVRQTHGVQSALELEFERCYRRFLMPRTRDATVGSKKRYAGTVEEENGTRLVIKGLEAVRTDWTPLARRFQRELLRRVFAGEPYGSWIRSVSIQLFAGEFDDELIYRKRLRRPLEDYAKNGAPPHVVAARALGGRPHHIEYVVTTQGPQPVGQVSAPLDYDHYLHRQLAPAGDTVLGLLGDDVLRYGGRQLRLF